MKKIISISKVWSCENMDLNAPINWGGYNVLFDDNTSSIVGKAYINVYEMASEEEKKDFARRLGYVFEGDIVETVKGRKIPIGERKIVKSSYKYEVRGTYGHIFTEYLVFSDGSKTNINNVKPVNIRLFNNGYLRFAEKLPSFYRGGRI